MMSNPWLMMGLASLAIGSGALLLDGEGSAAGDEAATLHLAQVGGDLNLAQADPEPADDDDEDIQPPDGIDTPEEWAKLLSKQSKDLERREQDLQIALQKLANEKKEVEAKLAKAIKEKESADAITRGRSKGGVGRALLPPQKIEEKRDRVASIVKKMKPKKAAKMVTEWDDIVAIEIMWRLPARISSAVLAAMKPKDSGRLTRRMATGWGVEDAAKEKAQKARDEKEKAEKARKALEDASREKTLIRSEPAGGRT